MRPPLDIPYLGCQAKVYAKLIIILIIASLHATIGLSPKAYLHQLRVDTRYNLEDLPGAMDAERINVLSP